MYLNQCNLKQAFIGAISEKHVNMQVVTLPGKGNIINV